MPKGRELVAWTLALGLTLGVILICGAVFINAVQHQEPLSDNATQVITAVFGGIIGVIGSYLGFKAGEHHARSRVSSESNDENREANSGESSSEE